MDIMSMDLATEEQEEQRSSSFSFNDFDTIFNHAREPLDSDVGVILLKQHYDTFGNETRSYDYKVWGKSIKEWVALAFDACPILELEFSEDDDLLQTIQPYLSDKKYTAVFYADTPLFTRQDFLEILDYAKSKRMNVCRVERGYIFVTDYLRTAQKVYATATPALQYAEDFMIVKDMATLSQASATLKQRILTFHLNNGVQIIDTNWTSIDADVVIGSGAVIYPNNILMGNTEIESGVILQVGNTITDSYISSGCVLKNSIIENSKIRNNTTLGPFAYISNGETKR